MVTRREAREYPRACFTPREPDQAVMQWGHTLKDSGRQCVLDIGCGEGRHVIYLARLGLAVTGGDLSPLALAQAGRWLLSEGLRAALLRLEMTELPFANESFDAALCVNVLHHDRPRQARAAVEEVWRVLRPGGLFLVVLAGAGDCRCFLERPVASTRGVTLDLDAPPQSGREGDLRDLFAGFNILGAQRCSLSRPGIAGPVGWWGVNWRIWAERAGL